MNIVIKSTLAIVASLAILLLTFWIASKGIWGSEETECLQWKSWAKSYQNFYLTRWQKSQCDAHKIEIDAPVQ